MISPSEILKAKIRQGFDQKYLFTRTKGGLGDSSDSDVSESQYPKKLILKQEVINMNSNFALNFYLTEKHFAPLMSNLESA